ncbi:MAG: hypothetical protein H0T56_14435, partial [Pseudaminobacter sp.]|nr:hypothetical protein [Pseudaminobacter sp.]
MKPATIAARASRWLMAAGLAFASLGMSPAAAQTETPMLELERDGDPIRERESVEPFFEKVGKQISCEYVRYRLRFGAEGDPEKLNSEKFINELKEVRMDFRDQLPAGLSVVNVEINGDITDAAGGAAPTAAVSTIATTDDTVTIEDFRLSGVDLDGDGLLDRRYFDVIITAKIDHDAFPAATTVDNQGFVSVTRPVGPPIEVPSHDPALPDDGDFLTGKPTRIGIDVTDCEPPPPPPPPGDDEACFAVETGDVDCVPGGGAFIYNMPVGPEMAGRWVQLRTTTPGIAIAPALQLVPAGGGVLSWTITGALPGDVVHLIVTGIETYAGPEEGVGLCCTQTVDLVIPEDLDCPDEERGEPDIKIEKRADVATCTVEGGCNFTITVSNVGDAPYNGKIVLDEVTLPGNATIDSGPNPPWVCAPLTSPMSCEHPATTLNPGESIDLTLGFMPGPGWDARFIRNCAEYDYTASEKDLFGSQANDKACAVIKICRPNDRDCRPPVEKKVDLGIVKRALTPVCSPDGVCLFRIDVINTGTETIDGPITVIDEYPVNVPASSDFVPSPPWSCVPEVAGRFRCDHPAVVLVPGASIPLGVKAIAGDGFPSDVLENCAEVLPVADESNLANNKSCAKARIPRRDPGKPTLRITKTCDAVAGAAISCRITVISLGTAAPSGPVRVNDAAELIGAGTPVQIQTVTPDGAEWSCGPVPADALSCQIPGEIMTPGTSRHFDVTLSVSPNERFENCARASYGPAPGDDIVYPIGEACAQGGAAIKVEKTGDRECRVGEPCTFEITIRNDSDSGFDGPVRIGDAIGVEGLGRLDGVAISEIVPPFGCAPEPATLPISCVADLSLGAGEARVHQVTVVIPDDGRFDNQNGPINGRNCVAVLSPDTAVRGGLETGEALVEGRPEEGEYACHPFTISKPEQPADQCSQGLVMNDAGRCVCPEGTTFRNGQCTDGGTTPTPTPKPRDPQPQQCDLLPGQIRTQDNRCVCPRGTDLRNGRCVKDTPPVQQCKLLPGQIRTQAGRCVCPRGTELRNNRCVKDVPPVQQCKLLPGQIRTQAGRCVCPRGTELRSNRCVKDVPPVRQCTLLPGQIRTKDNRCICPRGTSLVRGQCRQTTAECPKGTALVRGRCVLNPREPQCRKGQV